LLVFARFAGVSAELSRDTRLSIVVASVALATVTYLVLERPMRTGGFARLKAAVLCVAMLVAGGIGFRAYAGPPLVSILAVAERIATFTFPYKHAYRGGSCFPWAEQDATAFPSTCDGDGRVLLWGDSQAAHLTRASGRESRNSPS